MYDDDDRFVLTDAGEAELVRACSLQAPADHEPDPDTVSALADPDDVTAGEPDDDDQGDAPGFGAS